MNWIACSSCPLSLKDSGSSRRIGGEFGRGVECSVGHVDGRRTTSGGEEAGYEQCVTMFPVIYLMRRGLNYLIECFERTMFIHVK